MERLNPSRLASVASAIAQPRYDRDALECGIVHLGLEAPERAHLMAATDAALHADTGDMRWGIAGVALRDAALRDALAPQSGLYTLSLRDTGDDGAPSETLQVLGSLTQVLFAPDDPSAVLERIADPQTRIVSLTVGESGHPHHAASGALKLDDPGIVDDLANPASPRTAIGFIVHALALRRERGLPPLTLLGCDNLPDNGRLLKGLVLAFADRVDPQLREWIDNLCTFPGALADRIVVPSASADRERIATRLGLEDAAPVVAERSFEWIVEDRFANGRPAWQAGGARMVERADPFEQVKLRMVNGSLSAIACLGVLAGWRTVDQAMAIPSMQRYVDSLLQEEVAPTLPSAAKLGDFDVGAYRERLLKRLANPALQHATSAIASDGSVKLPRRLLGAVRDRLDAHEPVDRLALAVAAWIECLGGKDESGAAIALKDPLAAELARQHRRIDDAGSLHDGIAAFLSYAPVFATLGAELRFVSAVVRQTMWLRQRGVLATLEIET